MEVSPLPTSSSESWAENFTAALHRQRDRVREFLAAQQERLQRAEARLAQQLQQLADESARSQTETRQAKEEARQQSEQLSRQIESLESLRQEFAARQAEWAQFQQRATLQQEALLEQVRCRQDDLERRRAELERQHAAEQAALRQQLEQQHTGEQATLRQQLDGARQHETALAAEVESWRARCDQLAQQCAETSLRPGADEQKENEDYRRRYELALDDLRELKTRNADLQQQLVKASAGGPPRAAGGVLDWEAEKQRILSALESDVDEDDDSWQAERSKIEEVIRTTEQILAEKDRQIAELEQLLENQGGNLGAATAGAAVLGETLDKDAVIQEERENLKRLQELWREKLRQAEIDISVERATNARERAQIEEKLRALENRGVRPGGKSDEAEHAGKPVRGRWLARLGLKDQGPEDGTR